MIYVQLSISSVRVTARHVEFTFFRRVGRGGSRVQTQTCPRACTQAHAPAKATTFFFFLLRGRARGPRQPGTSGVTFCPLLLGAQCRSSAAWADIRHQAGCRAGREHSLTFVEVVLARKKKLFSFSPVLAFPTGQVIAGVDLVARGTGPAQTTVLRSGQRF